MSAGLIGIGLLIYAIAADVVKLDESSIHAPRWVLALMGGVFFTPGVMFLAEGYPRLQQLLTGAMLLSFAALGIWVALAGDPEQMSGGLFFLPRAANIGLGRVCFGLGGLLCLFLAVWAAARGLRGEM